VTLSRHLGSPVSLTSVTSDYLQVRLSILHFARLSRPMRFGLPVPLRHVRGFPALGLLRGLRDPMARAT
jgi:hypothetical protein